MTQRFEGNEASKILSSDNFIDQAAIAQGNGDSRKLIRKVTIDLSEERTSGNAYSVGFPFQSLYVALASDSSTEINFNPFVSDINSDRDAIPLKLKDVLNFERPISKTFLTWSAQSGKEVTLVFILDGSFESGSTLTEISSSVEGNSFSDFAEVTVTNAGFTEVLAQDLNRKVANLSFSNDVYLGSSGASTNTFKVLAGAQVKISNTGTLYAKAVGADSIVSGLIES